MAIVSSADGTAIAYSIEGAGPSVLLVDGAMCYREMGPMKAIAEAMGSDFQVYFFDRRGRGESGNVLPYSAEREIEDIEAMIGAAGGEVCLFGISSGAILAAQAAARLKGIKKLALFEGPIIIDDTEKPLPDSFRPRIKELVDSGRVSDAVKMFMGRVGMPRPMIWVMSLLPVWKKIISAGDTLPHDLSIVEPYQKGRPLRTADWSSVTMPTLVMDGGKSPQYMRNSQKQWSDVLPDAAYRTLPGQTHNVKTEAIVPELKRFFS